MANKLVGRSTELLNKFIQYGKARIQPGLKYFNAKFSNELFVSLSAFKAACLFVPAKLKEMKPDITIVNSLKNFTFLNNQGVLDCLKSEFPQYIAKAADASPGEDTLLWWVNHSEDLPNSSSAAKMVVLVQPSSAAVEQVFSILKGSFGHLQDNSL